MSIAMRRGVGAIAASGASLTAGVHFDGTNDYLSDSGAMTGAADSKLFTLSVWVLFDATGGDEYIFTTAGGGKFIILKQSDNKLFIQGDSPAGATILQAAGGTVLSSSTWYNILISCDMSDTGKRDIFINGSDDSPTWNIYTDSAIDFTGNSTVGSNHTGGSKLSGDMAEFWFEDGVYTDFSQSANREKYALSGIPVDLGTNGENPTATSPVLYLGQVGATPSNFAANKGTGGGFTENGALTLAPTSPSY